jgi:hypothetical protein
MEGRRGCGFRYAIPGRRGLGFRILYIASHAVTRGENEVVLAHDPHMCILQVQFTI